VDTTYISGYFCVLSLCALVALLKVFPLFFWSNIYREDFTRWREDMRYEFYVTLMSRIDTTYISGYFCVLSLCALVALLKVFPLFFWSNIYRERILLDGEKIWHEFYVPLMSRIERKYCAISTSYLTGLFDIFILLTILSVCILATFHHWIKTLSDTYK